MLAVDPGDSTGLAWWKDGPENIEVACLTDRWETLDFIRNFDCHILVVEEYRLYPWVAKAQSWSDLPTARLIGAIELVAHDLGLELRFQPASVKKAGFAQAKARGFDVGLDQLKTQHEKDAAAHLIVATFKPRAKEGLDADVCPGEPRMLKPSKT